MTVDEKARVRAAKLAQNLHLGRTMVAIQDGCSVDTAFTSAFDEHITLHQSCPCCRGSYTKAEETAKLIVAVMIA